MTPVLLCITCFPLPKKNGLPWDMQKMAATHASASQTYACLHSSKPNLSYLLHLATLSRVLCLYELNATPHKR